MQGHRSWLGGCWAAEAVNRHPVVSAGVGVHSERALFEPCYQCRGKMGFIRLMPGVERLLHHLKAFNIPMAIASGCCRDSFRIKTRRHSRLFDVFHHVVLSGSDEEVKRGKPAPDVFLTTASRFEESPEPSKCLVFESSLVGMEAALSAGMQVVLVPDPLVSFRASAPATLRLRSLEGFKPQYFGLPPL